MSTHGEAPGPGYALVVNQAGFSQNPTVPSRRLALSGEGMLACFWLSMNPLWKPETWPEPGTFIKLPISNWFMEMVRADVNGWEKDS